MMVGLRADCFLCENDGRVAGISFSKAEGGLRSALDSSAPRGAPLADPPSLFAPSGQTNKKHDHGFSTKKLPNHEAFYGLVSLTRWFHFY